MDTLAQTLEGKYEILSKIKEGGMGAIYLVRHRLLNELRVVKVMRPEVAESEEQQKRFFREAQTATRLRHPNIITFYDFAMGEDGAAYMVMEFIDGVNLHDLLRAQGTPPISLALEISRQTLSALGYLHRKGVIHRDISPDNIMVTQEEDASAEVKLIDLGIAKVANSRSELTAADSFVGKLRYCSPEQLKGTGSLVALDPRSDLYSYAVVFYEMLTGRIPFEGDSMQSLIAAHLFHPPVPIEKSDPDGRVPEQLGRVIMRMLDGDPDKRYQTAEEFSRAIDEAMPAPVALDDREASARYIAPALLKNPVREFTKSGKSAQASLDNKFGAWTTKTHQISGEKLLDVSLAPRTKPMPGAAPPRTNVTAIPLEKETAVGGRPSQSKTRVIPSEAMPPAAAAPRRPIVPIAIAGVLAIVVAAALWTLLTPKAVPHPVTPTTTLSTVPSTSTTSAGAGSASTGPPASSTSLSTSSSTTTSTRPAETSATQTAGSTTKSLDEKKPGEKTAATDKSVKKSQETKPVEQVAKLNPPATETQHQIPGTVTTQIQQSSGPYCVTIYPTAFHQGKISEKPKGFASDSEQNVAPLPDSARLQIVIKVAPNPPIENQPFEVAASFVNKGDLDRTVHLLEESVPRTKGGFVALSAVSLPARVESGGSLSFYRFSGVLSGRFLKDLRVTDSRGDSWESSIRIDPCD